MSFRALASAAGIGLGCFVLGACHLLLEGQDIPLKERETGGGGDDGQGGDGGAAVTTTSASVTTSTTTSSTGTAGYNDACDAPLTTGFPCVTDPGNCALDPGRWAFRFHAECPNIPGPWCSNKLASDTQFFDIGQGRLTAQVEGLTGWWDTPANLEYPPFLFRKVPSNTSFAIVTRIQSMTITAGTYNVAGLTVRRHSTNWSPSSMDEWIKLEYGNRGNAQDNYAGYGVLLGAANGMAVRQVNGSPGTDPTLEDNVELAICRNNSSNFTFAFRRPALSWETLTFDPSYLPPLDSGPLQVGVSAGAYEDNQSSVARFGWVLYAVEPFSDCLEEITELVAESECAPP